MSLDSSSARVLPFGPEEDRWRLERRAAWLRPAVLVILAANLWAGERHANHDVHLAAVGMYALATGTAVWMAQARMGPRWAGSAFIVVDALLVLALLHEHLVQLTPTLDHAVTAAVTASSFLLLSHSALRLRANLVGLFAGLVLAGWLPLAAYAALRASTAAQPVAYGAEAALAAAFAFASLTLLMLISEHGRAVRGAVESERRRANLSRFFAPAIVGEIEASGRSIALERRFLSVMFVDLRCFSEIARDAAPLEVATLLSEYRNLVTDTVFAWRGTVDKFMGDGVMAVFGYPHSAPDDARRALRCAEELAERLARWSEGRAFGDNGPVRAGIGLHCGEVVAGLLACRDQDELSVFGDAVNVAERLERASKALDARVVTSMELVACAGCALSEQHWLAGRRVSLEGSDRQIEVAYMPRDRPAVSGPRVRKLDIYASNAAARAAPQ